jgi:putative SOS response-associated peptidase YedK
MCTRYKLTIEEQELLATYVAELFMDDYRPRYNIAPTQTVPALVIRDGKRRIEGFRFGLVPYWAKDVSIGNKLLNARSETVAEKPSYRGAWKHARRCAILTDGFYEWKAPAAGKGSKIPHVIEMADRRPFALAGLWERWGPDADPLQSVTILTTAPNELLGSIHDRMPVVLGDAEEWNAWVDPSIPSEELTTLFRPYPAEEMHAYAVSTYVNKPGNEGPQAAEPVAPAGGG